MRVLGISIWIHFIWIFVVGVLLFFYNVHDGFEGFQGTANSGTAGSTLGTMPSSYIPVNPVYINGYIPSNQSWQPINIQTERFTYRQRFPVGAQLVSENGAYALLFTSSNGLFLYDTTTMKILWQTPLPTGSSYIFHQGTIDVFLSNGTKSTNLFAATIGSQSGTQPLSLTTSYLKLENNGDLVLYSIDGDILFRTNTGVAPNLCKPVNLSYPVTSSDCFNLQSHISDYTSDIAKHSLAGRTGEQDAAQQGLCVSQAYYKQLSCDAYIASHSNPSSAPAPVAPPAPRASIYGSLASGSKQIIVVGDVSTSIMAGDMIYLGYGITIQGPFFVQNTMITPLKPVQGALLSVQQTNINITKHYIGTDIVYPAILSVLPAFRDAGVLRMSSTPVTSRDGSPLIATVYPGDRTIGISSGTSGSSGSSTNYLPDLSIGDIIYLNKDGCNTFDTIQNDVCVSYLCKMGEIDIGDNICKPFLCGSTTDLAGVVLQDINNGDGTCSSPTTYIPCQAGETLNASNNTCGGSGYSYTRAVDKASVTYDPINSTRGVRGRVYLKPIFYKPKPFSLPTTSVYIRQFEKLRYDQTQVYNTYLRDEAKNEGFYSDPNIYTKISMEMIAKLAMLFELEFSGPNFSGTKYTTIGQYKTLANYFIDKKYDFELTSIMNDINTRETYILSTFTTDKTLELIRNCNSAPPPAYPSTISNYQTNLNTMRIYQTLNKYMINLATKCSELFEPYSQLRTALDLILTFPISEPTPPSYIYSSNSKLGPFIVAAQPTANKILIRSVNPGDLDLNGKFKMSANSARRAAAAVSAKLVNETTSIARSPVTFLNSFATPIESNIVPDIGFTDARIYRVAYKLDPLENISIRPGYNSDIVQINSDKSMRIDSLYGTNNSDIDCSFIINDITLLNGHTYTVSMSVNSNSICSLELLSPVAGTSATSPNAGVDIIRRSFFSQQYIPGISKSYMANANLVENLSSFFSNFSPTDAADFRNKLTAGAYSYPSSSAASTRVTLSATPTTYTWTINSIKGSSLYLRAYVPAPTRFTFSNIVVKDTTTNTILRSGGITILGACTPGTTNCCPVGYKCDETSVPAACPANTYNMPGNVGSCIPCNPSDTTLSGTTVCGRTCTYGTFASPGTNICNQKDVTGNNGSVTCTRYCNGEIGSNGIAQSWNGELPLEWGGAICVGTPEKPWVGCDVQADSPIICRCQASPGKGWNT